MTANPPDSLPSTVERTLAVCPKFRILVVGNTGVGKSSLVSSVFNIGIKDIDIAHNRAGKANIAREYTSDTNARFILHDSQGFEPGSAENWEVVEKFIRDRCDERLEAKDRLHAIWLCIETPRTGSRLMQTADEQLLALATDLKVAVIIVFTKYDILFNECHRKASKEARRRPGKSASADTICIDAEKNATDFLNTLIDNFPKRPIEYVTVSTSEKYPKCFSMLKKLTETTRRCLHDVEGELWVPWAAAQQINAQQKVNFSINEGFKKYWVNLGKSTVFKGHILLDCLSRIHLDIIEVWNFYDPEKLLPGTHFCQEMIKFIQPLLTEPQPRSNMSKMLSNLSAVTTIVAGFAAACTPVLTGAGITVVAVEFLRQKYQAVPLTALCLGAYIVDLILILHNLFIATLVREPPRRLTWELVMDTLESYKNSDAGKVHELIRDIVSGTGTLDPKERIADLIRQQLNIDRE